MHDAHKELRASAAARSYHHAGTGMRDYTAAVQALDEIWRSQFAAGAIKPVPRRGASGPSARVDGAAVAQEGDDTDGVLFAAPDKRITSEQLRREPNCWVCRGFGHCGADCASAKGFRPISECITVLQTILDRAPPSRGGKGKGKGASRFGKGGGRGRAGTSGRGRFAGSGLYVDDGFVFTSDGECLVVLLTMMPWGRMMIRLLTTKKKQSMRAASLSKSTTIAPYLSTKNQSSHHCKLRCQIECCNRC